MRRDDELRFVLHEVVHPREHRHLPGGRECGLRFIKNVEAMALEPIHEKRHEGLAMRLRVKGPPSVILGYVETVDLRSNVEEALRSEKIAVFRTPDAFRGVNELMQLGVGFACGEPEVS